MDQSHKSATLDWTTEDEYWRSHYKSRPYAATDDYATWQPAYRYGYEGARKYHDRRWKDAENDLRSGWASYEYDGASTWERVKDAVRDAWNRMTGEK